MPGLRRWSQRGIIVVLLLLVATTFGAEEQPSHDRDSDAFSEYTPVHIAQLISQTKDYDGKAVSIAGEAIGDLMVRKDHAWVNILENGVAIGVWLTESQASLIHGLGRYGSNGDTFQIGGIFHRACPDHGGETDIHATEVRLLRKGNTYHVNMKIDRLLAGLGLCFSGGLLTLLWRHRDRKNKDS